MAIDPAKLGDALEAAARVFNATVALAQSATEAFSPGDQGELRARLTRLREENEAGFRRLDDKLARLIQGVGGNHEQ